MNRFVKAPSQITCATELGDQKEVLLLASSGKNDSSMDESMVAPVISWFINHSKYRYSYHTSMDYPINGLLWLNPIV
jgi:hypothetical protein